VVNIGHAGFTNTMEQLKLDLEKSEVQLYVYTCGIVRGTQITRWFVRNSSPEKDKLIMEKLLQFPDTIPVQSDHKFYR